MKVEVNKKITVDIEDDQLEHLTAQTLKNTYWNMLDDLTEYEKDCFDVVYYMFTSHHIFLLER